LMAVLRGEIRKTPEKLQLAGGWPTYPSEKYESVGMMTFPTVSGKS
jgi:hypothetical protein